MLTARLVVIATMLGIAACVAPTSDDSDVPEVDDSVAPAGAPLPDDEPADPIEEEIFDDPDYAPDEIEVPGTTQALGAAAPQTVFVNFGGPVVKGCDGCSDARRNRSLVISQYLHKSSVDFAAFTDRARRTEIVAHLRRFFSRYAIRFTVKRPAAGEFTMLVITPSYAPNHGIAPLDCKNANRSDIAFVFRTGSYSAKFIAQEAAHELGHSFGLAHVTGRGDIMQWASSGDAFTRSTYDTAHRSGKCFQGSTQNGPALLEASLGLR